MNLSFQLSPRIKNLIGKEFNFPVNCFSISQIFYQESIPRKLTADEMLDFTAMNFRQTEASEFNLLNLVWSRSSAQLAIGEIQISELARRRKGFPFGLILEHSFIQLDNYYVFQKADPTIASKVEITSLDRAIEPYMALNGFEVTRHLYIGH